MPKIFGGNASRLEMYGLFVAAVILIGGGVSGAVVLTSTNNPIISQAVNESPVESQSGRAATSAPTSSEDAAVDGIRPPNGQETRPSPLSDQGESASEIGTSPKNVETDDQRNARLQQERYDYAAANPVARFEDIEILSCTELPVYSRENPAMVVDTAILVRYSIAYEVFHQMNAYSFVNPGLPVYQTTESDARQMIISNSAFAPQLQLELGPGRHSMVLHGLRFPNSSVRNVEVRFGPADSTYGYAQFDLPSIGPICE